MQISEWEAYDKIDPIGTWRSDYRMANLMSFLSNMVNAIYATKNASPELRGPMDFMPDWSGDRPKIKKQSVDVMKDMFLTIAKDQNKKIAKDKALEIALNKPPKLLEARLAIEKAQAKKLLDNPQKDIANTENIGKPKTLRRHGYRRKPDNNAGN